MTTRISAVTVFLPKLTDYIFGKAFHVFVNIIIILWFIIVEIMNHKIIVIFIIIIMYFYNNNVYNQPNFCAIKSDTFIQKVKFVT